MADLSNSISSLDDVGRWARSYEMTASYNIGDFQQACHYSNLQPLWVDNFKKSNKMGVR